jgi:hypothetical protein
MSLMATIHLNIPSMCAICSRHFSLNSVKVCCSLCKCWMHVKCNSHDMMRYNTCSQKEWYCSRCLVYGFAFNHVEDDLQFRNCLYELKHDTNNILISAEQFKICSEVRLTNNKDIDPDRHFYSNQVNTNCNYFLPQELSKLSLTYECLSLLHMNARSPSKNHEHLTTLIITIDYSFTDIAVSETWANEYNIFYLTIPGY